jgi:hypothetical protein
MMTTTFQKRRETNIQSFKTTMEIVGRHNPSNPILPHAVKLFNDGHVDAAVDSLHSHIYEYWSAHLTGGAVVSEQKKDTTDREVKKTTFTDFKAHVTRLSGKTQTHVFVVDTISHAVWLFDIPTKAFAGKDSIAITVCKNNTFGKWTKYFKECYQ